MVFLHGVIRITIKEAKGLPNPDAGFFRRRKNKADAYVVVSIRYSGRNTHELVKTRVIDNDLSPEWDEKFRVDLCHNADSLVFDVRDMDLVKVEHMGTMSIPADRLAENEEGVSGWYGLDGGGQIFVSFAFVPEGALESTNEVPDTVFPMRTGCVVKLYQDAHTPAVPPVSDVLDANGERYQPPQLWVDITDAIENAQKFIYIVGWSVKADVSLVRGPDEHESLGDMLKRKANEGVRVLIMVWNEALSTDFYLPGLMGTHDEVTQAFFEGSDVEIVLTPRRKKNSKLRDKIFVSTSYTHHQKCVIVDAEIEGDDSKRRLIAFAGGVDLTDGRYDTPEHSLFKTLPFEHKNDFYNGVCASTVESGPREPWHDIHMYVEGKPAMDLVTNFMDRWRCQAEHRQGRLYHVDEDEFDLNWEPSGDAPTWNVQLFRSINSDSAEFDNDVLGQLMSKRGKLFDNSIQRAYIHHIRQAKRFIYIENQYFLGSAHSWFNPETKCPHLVPVELTARIVKAIRSGEDFRVYVLIPIHPEGDPTSAAVQEILHWQHRTMEMMYGKIAKAIFEAGVDTHPTDYLCFFCLGKRENPDDVPRCLKHPDREQHAVACKVRDSLRFMIYVHSKMAIFDDEYIIVGSANINERSMSGNRDSEMALGAYQPRFTTENSGEGNEVNGSVRTFRLALWAEHCGETMEEHLSPTSADCIARMRGLGEANFQKFLSPEAEHNDSHLMIYPLNVSQEGDVVAREDCPNFPDTGGAVTGQNSNFLPNAITT